MPSPVIFGAQDTFHVILRHDLSPLGDIAMTALLNEPTSAEVCISCDAAQLTAFFPLLQKGFLIKTLSGKTIRAVLCDQIGVTREYLDNRINTIFLDSKPVDNVDSAVIKEGSVLALSAAMPGFVGAAFRKGGYYASMRGSITHAEDSAPATSREGFFFLKLYNFVAKELGPLFLELGIWLPSDDVKELFEGRPDGFWSDCKGFTIDDREVDLSYFLGMQWLHEVSIVRLRVLQG
jgi:hypothetical protein